MNRKIYVYKYICTLQYGIYIYNYKYILLYIANMRVRKFIDVVPEAACKFLGC